ncbi:MAG: amino acid--tRNA ligase-related protein [bacterium]
MGRVLIKEAIKTQGQSVKIAGWVHNIRVLKGLIFVVIRDISGQIQVVVEEGNQSAFNAVNGLNLESILEIEGQVQEKPSRSDEKEYEILASQAKVLSIAAEQMPIPVMQKTDNEADIENRFNWRWIDLRKPEHQMVFKTWTELEKGFRKSLADNNFIQIYTPTFMSTASETGSEVFAVKYFDKEVYLAQSPQFYKQMAMASGLDRVFVVGPVYRAEKSFTNRHSTEFTGWDLEMSYINSDQDLMDLEEDLIIAGFKQVKKALKIKVKVPKKPFPRITMAEAKARLAKKELNQKRMMTLALKKNRHLARL